MYVINKEYKLAYKKNDNTQADNKWNKDVVYLA